MLVDRHPKYYTAEARDFFEIISSYYSYRSLTKQRKEDGFCGGQTRVIDIYRDLTQIIVDGLVFG